MPSRNSDTGPARSGRSSWTGFVGAVQRGGVGHGRIIPDRESGRASRRNADCRARRGSRGPAGRARPRRRSATGTPARRSRGRARPCSRASAARRPRWGAVRIGSSAGSGSGSKTSRPAPASRSCSSASASAAWSTIGPRATLTRNAVGFISASRRRSMRCRVSGSAGKRRRRRPPRAAASRAARASTSVLGTGVRCVTSTRMPHGRAGARRRGRCGRSRSRRACGRSALAQQVEPPSAQRPSRSARSRSSSRCESASTSVTAAEAIGRVTPPGVIVTAMPRSVHARGR